MSQNATVDTRLSMTARSSELEHLTRMLGQCLGRIDEQAYRLQSGEESSYDIADQLEDETAQLQELVSSLIALHTGAEETDVNHALAHVASSCVTELEIPIVLRQNLAQDLPAVPFPPAMVSVALQRATMLAIGGLQPGGDLVLTTRRHEGTVLVEIEAHGCEEDERLGDRTQTLREFVHDFGGNCHAHCERSDVFVVLELPLQLATDPSDSY